MQDVLRALIRGTIVVVYIVLFPDPTLSQWSGDDLSRCFSIHQSDHSSNIITWLTDHRNFQSLCWITHAAILTNQITDLNGPDGAQLIGRGAYIFRQKCRWMSDMHATVLVSWVYLKYGRSCTNNGWNTAWLIELGSESVAWTLSPKSWQCIMEWIAKNIKGCDSQNTSG